VKLADISGTKKMEYLKDKIEELQTNSGGCVCVKKWYTGINDFKGYQPRTNIVKDEKGDLVIHSHGILSKG
jgi:hypothetical protein